MCGASLFIKELLLTLSSLQVCQSFGFPDVCQHAASSSEINEFMLFVRSEMSKHFKMVQPKEVVVNQLLNVSRA
jgi:hypothetical protein